MESNIRVQEILDELMEDVLNPELIQDNKLHFQHDKVLYRVQMPTQKDIADASEKRNQRLIYLKQQPNTLTTKQLKKLLKDTNEVDIDVLDSEILNLENKLKELCYSLAQHNDNEIDTINKLKIEIDEVKLKRRQLIEERAEYLSPSINNQAQNEYFKYITACVTERYEEVKNEKDELSVKWTKQWQKYSDYENDISKLAYVALGRLLELMINV